MSDEPGHGERPAPPPSGPGYLIPSDAERGVGPSDAPAPAPPPPPTAPPPAADSGPSFTLPSAEPESPVGTPPPRDQAPDEPATSIGGYGAGATSGPGSYAQSGPPAPGDYAQDAQASAPAAYGQPSAPAYGQPAAPGYGQPGPPRPPYQQPAPPPGYPPAGAYGAPAGGYGAPQPGPPPGGYAVPPPSPYGVVLPASKPPNSGMAVGAMVTGIASCAIALAGLCSWIIGVPAILAGGAGLVLGIIARKNTSTTSGSAEQGGAGMALAGIICGAIGAGIGLISVVIWVIVIAVSFS